MEETKVVETEETKETKETEEVGQEEAKAPFQFDYEKLASIVTGKQTATEDSVLKGYFKQQGLSPEEMSQAISSFKEQKAQSMPDVNALQTSVNEANQRALQAETQMKAVLMADELGVDTKAMPYLVRMADLTEITASGSVDEVALKEKLQEIVEAIPSLKQSVQQGGFQVVGGETPQRTEADDDELYRIFNVKKK